MSCNLVTAISGPPARRSCAQRRTGNWLGDLAPTEEKYWALRRSYRPPMPDLINPLTTLAAVLIGAALSQSVQARSWRRERRAEAYAAVLTRLSQLDHQRERRSFDDPFHELEAEELFRLTEPLRGSVGLAHLYAGSAVASRLNDVVQVGYDRNSGSEASHIAWHEATSELRDAMRRDLHGRRRRTPRKPFTPC